jgi:hypothetical protein
VSVRAGGFLLDERAGTPRPAGTVYTGQELAAALTPLQLFGGELRLWLRWPDQPADQRRLDDNLAELAETTGATVWTPPVGGRAVVLDGCRDLAARAGNGEVGPWRSHRPLGTTAPTLATDLDGRLVPAGGVHRAGAGGVRLVSVAANDERRLLDQYAQVRRQDGLFLAHFALLAGGRLAFRYADGSLLPLGGREARRLLRDAGWTDEEVCLLTAVPAQPPPGLPEHLATLVAELGVAVWTAEPGSTVAVRDGLPRAANPAGRAASWRPALPAGAAAPPRWHGRDGWLASADEARPEPIMIRATSGTVPPPSHRPSMVPAVRPGRPHGVRWLPERLEVNEQPLCVYVTSPWPPERVAVEGLPSADLFLIGYPDGERAARSAKGGYLLALQVRPGTVIDPMAVYPYAPPVLRQRLTAAGSYLLPAGWLDRAVWQAGYTVDDSGHPTRHGELAAHPVVLRCTGARHGTDGLPDDVVPSLGGRATTRYALVTAEPADFLRLHRHRPPVARSGRLVHLRVAGGRAIDVPASAARIAGLNSVRSRLAELAADGVELLLPSRAFGRATVTRVYLPDDGGWRAVPGRGTLPLPELLSAAAPHR